MPQDVMFQADYLLPYHLQFFAKEGPGGEKTEDATTKKLQDARKEGQVAISKELTTSAELTTLFLILKLFVGYIAENLINTYKKIYLNIEEVVSEEFTAARFQDIFTDSLFTVFKIVLPVFLTGMAVAFIIVLFQVKWKLSGKLMKPKLSKINPISGFRKIFSKDKAVELIIEILKILTIAYIAYKTLMEEWDTLLILYEMDLIQGVLLLGNLVINLGLRISMIFLIIGVADLIYQKLKFKKDMKMTKQEVKDEFKQTEGDPHIKGRIRNKMREVSQRRMMQALPQADVVITNPTHLAAAIKYDKETAGAPILLAKGADYLAIKIKEAAKEYHIEIVENKPLARMLYYNVELGQEIPPELYQMTAEVLAYVYGLKK